MTPKKFIILTLLLWAILIFLKVWLFNNQIVPSSTEQMWVLWLLTAGVTVAITRSFGVLNYFEIFFSAALWTVVGIFLDLIITSSYTGLGIFSRAGYWVSYLFLIVPMVFLHKKRHVHVRKEQQAHHHHGHHYKI